MLFSAIAMVAFTVSAIATIEVIESVEVVTASSSPCTDQWRTDMAVLQGNYPGSQMNLSFDEALEIADKLYDKCLNDIYGSGSKNNNTVTGPAPIGLSK